MQSCLHDNKDVFDTPAGQRLEERVAAEKQLLVSATNGWKFEYYVGEGYTYGGYNYIAKFDADGKAYVSSELYPSDSISSSSWDIVTDQGPVLTFNTHNEIMHYLSQPYSTAVEGFQGDYEFVIQKATSDSIYLKGKKWGNKMLMTRMPEDVTWKNYLDSIAAVEESMLYTYVAKINGDTVEIELDEENHFNAVSSKVDISVPFIFTTTGFKLAEPVDINGTQVQFFTYHFDEDTPQNSTMLSEGGLVTLNCVLPEGYQAFGAFEGSYTWSYYSGRYTGTVQFVPDKENKQYIIKGLSTSFDVIASYSPVTGSLTINSQQVGESGSTQVWLCAWALGGGGSLTWSTSAGVELVWNGDSEKPVYTFEDNGYGMGTDSFILWGLQNGSSAGQFTSWRFFGGSNQMAYLTSVTKITE